MPRKKSTPSPSEPVAVGGSVDEDRSLTTEITVKGESGEEVHKDSEDTEQVAIPDLHSVVYYKLGVTIGLPDFCSYRVDIGARTPCAPDKMQEAIRELKADIEAKLKEASADAEAKVRELRASSLKFWKPPTPSAAADSEIAPDNRGAVVEVKPENKGVAVEDFPF